MQDISNGAPWQRGVANPPDARNKPLCAVEILSKVAGDRRSGSKLKFAPNWMIRAATPCTPAPVRPFIVC